MLDESAHIIFKAMKVFEMFFLESLFIRCALLHLTGIRAQVLAGWLGKDRAWDLKPGPK